MREMRCERFLVPACTRTQYRPDGLLPAFQVPRPLRKGIVAMRLPDRSYTAACRSDTRNAPAEIVTSGLNGFGFAESHASCSIPLEISVPEGISGSIMILLPAATPVMVSALFSSAVTAVPSPFFVPIQ